MDALARLLVDQPALARAFAADPEKEARAREALLSADVAADAYQRWLDDLEQ